MARPVLLWTLAPVVAPKRRAFQVRPCSACSAGHGSAWLLCIPMFRQMWLSEVTAMLSHVITMSQNDTKCHCHLSITMSLYVMALDSTIPSKLHGKFKPYDTVLCIWVGLPPALVLQLQHAQKNYPQHFARFPSTFKDSFFQYRHAKVIQGHNSTPWRSWSSSQIRFSPRLVVFCPPSSHSGSGDTTTPATPEPGMISSRLCEQSAIQQLED